MPEIRVSARTVRCLAAWRQLKTELGLEPDVDDVGDIIREAFRALLSRHGYPDATIEAYLRSASSGEGPSLDILEPEGEPASAIIAAVDFRRRERQRQELIKARAQEKAARQAVRLMVPVLQAFDELSRTGVQLAPIVRSLVHQAHWAANSGPRPFPTGGEAQMGRPDRFDDVVSTGTELKLLLTEDYILVIRVCRSSAFTEQSVRAGAGASGLYYYGFLSNREGAAIANSECSTVETAELINWLAQAVAQFEYSPPNVLGERPLEEMDINTTRTRVIDISQ